MNSYELGYQIGLKRGKEGDKFPDGVDWHIIGTHCNCTDETIPVADNAGEDINLYEKLNYLKRELYKEPCEVCGKHVRVFYVEGNMASKRKAKNDL